MEWITKEEIQRRGKISPYEAFTVSIEKYEQWLCASEEELRKAIGDGKTSCHDSDYCGCCAVYGRNCFRCPLKDKGGTCCVEWRKLDFGNRTNKDSIRSLLCRLYQERDKLPKEEKKPCKVDDYNIYWVEEKPEIRLGEYGIVPTGFKTKKPHPVIADSKNLNLRTGYWQDKDGNDSCGYNSINGEKITNRGNIFDDLEALKEPLEEFCLATVIATVRFSIDEDGRLWIGKYAFPPKRLPEIILKLRRLVATAKRKQKQFESIRKDC